MIPRLPPPTRDPDVVIDGHPCHYVWRRPDVIRAKKNRDGTITASIDRASVPSVPRGVLVHHYDGRGGDCVMWLPWTGDPDIPDAPSWTLMSLHPLTLAEPFACQRCGVAGAIREGRWWWWHTETGRVIG